jgi:hypothetical protein
MILRGETEVPGEKLIPLLLSPRQILWLGPGSNCGLNDERPRQNLREPRQGIIDEN